MKYLKHSFSLKEDILLLILSLVMLGLVYYVVIDQPVRTGIANAQAEQQSLQVELTAATARLQELQKMAKELDEDKLSDNSMPSYNAIKDEMKLLNDIMSQTADYSISFSDVTKDGDQIRRNFAVNFVANDYSTAVSILQQLKDSPYRCLLDVVSCSDSNRSHYYDDDDIDSGAVSVSFTATFYETMVGGKADSGLPVEKEEASTSTDDTDLGY